MLSAIVPACLGLLLAPPASHVVVSTLAGTPAPLLMPLRDVAHGLPVHTMTSSPSATTSILAYVAEGVESGGIDMLIASLAPFAFGALALYIFAKAFKRFTDAY